MSAANRTETHSTPQDGDQVTRQAPVRDKGSGKVYRRVRNLALGVVLLAVVTVAVILGIDNQTPLAVRFLNRVSPEWPAFWWLCAAFGCGLLLGVTLCAASLVRGRLNQRQLRRSLHQRELEIDRLGDLRHE